MPPSPYDDLCSLLGTSLPGLEKLSPGHHQQLLTALRNARKIQETEYTAALEKALKHVPSLLRGSVRKIIAG